MDRCDSCGAVGKIKLTYKYTDDKVIEVVYYCLSCYFQTGPRP